MTTKEQKINPEDYFCSTHGGQGNPDCSICWENLEKLLGDMSALGKNVYMSGESIGGHYDHDGPA